MRKILLLLTVLAFTRLTVQAQESEMDDLFDMSLEELLEASVVTSVSKNEEKLLDVASAITVMTSHDIQNSGATNLHELLRRVPGYWGVSTEYNSASSTIRLATVDEGRVGSTLFLLDGTPVQDYMYSNFSYQIFDIPLHDIERIEVIKGSGGSIYGANSATGVISIFTKDPAHYNGITTKVEFANPDFRVASISGGKKLGDLSISGFGKYRHFEGYGLPDIYKGEQITVPHSEDPSQNITIANRYTEDFQPSDMFTAGIKAGYDISDKTRLSLRSHFNQLNQNVYTDRFLPETFFTENMLYLEETEQRRFAGNIKIEHSFSENHQLFARISNSTELNYQGVGGGFYSNNAMYDLEIQDNFILGNHAFNVGIDYRQVHFNIRDLKEPSQFNYTTLDATENITGAFIQDKISLLNNKLRLTLGIKAENYTLVNESYYFSPNLKFSVTPVKNVSIWGGYSMSYSTVGFTNTNLDYKIFRAPAQPFFFQQALPEVTENVYNQAYQQSLAMGLPEAQAAAAAEAYVQSDQGQGTINYVSDSIANNYAQVYPGYYNVEVNNGSNVEPIKFQNYDIGIRSIPFNWMTFESNFFYTQISDAVFAAPVSTINNPENQALPSLTTDGEFADKLYYGNYVQGNSKGLETIVRIKPSSMVEMEFSHTWLRTHLEYQENSDFDISQWSDDRKTIGGSTPGVPENIFRVSGYFTLPMDLQFSVDGLYGTTFNSQARYQMDKQRFTSILEISEGVGTIIGENDDRTIVNLKLQKSFSNDNWSVYLFGNDIFTDKRIENADNLIHTTYGHVGRMVGAGVIYQLNL